MLPGVFPDFWGRTHHVDGQVQMMTQKPRQRLAQSKMQKLI
jgi:hypothetical protein